MFRVLDNKQWVHSRRHVLSSLESPLSAPRSLGVEIGLIDLWAPASSPDLSYRSYEWPHSRVMAGLVTPLRACCGTSRGCKDFWFRAFDRW